MIKNFSIDSKVRARLIKIANTLPLMQELHTDGKPKWRYGTFKKKGSELLRQMPNMTDPATGKPLNPNEFYKILRPVYIDHYKELVKAWHLKGDKGIEIYVKSMVAAVKKYNTPAQRLKRFIQRVTSKTTS